MSSSFDVGTLSPELVRSIRSGLMLGFDQRFKVGASFPAPSVGVFIVASLVMDVPGCPPASAS